jgi:SAM-dependent methyltransferase
MTRQERYWDRIAKRYAARRVRDVAAFERTLAQTAAWLSSDKCVVEFGCGTGTRALRLAPAVGRIDATDFSAAMIEIATERARALPSGNLAFLHADLFDPEAVQGPYDAALAFNFLQLMDDLPGALTAVARRLKPGGLFISKSVCLGEGGWRTVRFVVRGLKAFGVLPPIQFLTSASLERSIAEAGFEILERVLHPERPPSLFLVARKAG